MFGGTASLFSVNVGDGNVFGSEVVMIIVVMWPIARGTNVVSVPNC